jgi:hypothetical protein
MAQSSKPTIILIPGFCSIASLVYEPLITELKSLGFNHVEPIDLPSINTIATKASLKPSPLEADIALIHSTLSKLVEEEQQEVIIVAHSYGGGPSLYSSEGLWKTRREVLGKKGGILQICLMSAALSLPGQSVGGVRHEWAAANPGRGIDVAEGSDANIEMLGEVYPNSFPPLTR